jgi:hypothetical protein
MTNRFISILLVLALLPAFPGTSRAADLPAPTGPVILTVTGNVEHANQGPSDVWDQSLFKHHDVQFDRAAAFDRAALERLGMHSVTAGKRTWPEASVFEGPLLSDVLAAAGATGRTVRVYALDDYVAEIPFDEIAAAGVVVGLKRDGRDLGIGGAGPTWIVYPDGETAEHGDKWVWAAYLITVE